MERETKLVAAAAGVLVLSVALVVTVPGALADVTPDPPPAELSVTEQTIAAGHVSGGTATLSVRSRLQHRGGPAENVTVLVLAVDSDTGLVAGTTTRSVGRVTDEREVSVTANVSVERDGDYRFETLVYRDGRRVAAGGKTVRGVGALQPAYARTGVEFHTFEGVGTEEWPPIQASVETVAGDTATLNVSAYVTNTGDAANDRLQVRFVARQADSKLVADRTVESVGEIRPGRTATPSTLLSVPDDYNYELLATIQRDGVIVGTAQATAVLNPNRTVTVEQNGTNDTFDTSDFERTEASGQREDEGVDTTESSGSGPGFGVGAVALALTLVALAARRYHD